MNGSSPRLDVARNPGRPAAALPPEAHARGAAIAAWVNGLTIDELRLCVWYAGMLRLDDGAAALQETVNDLPASVVQDARWSSDAIVAGRIDPDISYPLPGVAELPSSQDWSAWSLSLISAVYDAGLGVATSYVPAARGHADAFGRGLGLVKDFHAAYATCTPEHRATLGKLLAGTNPEHVTDLIAAIRASDLPGRPPNFTVSLR